MTVAVAGLPPSSICELFERFRRGVTGDPAADVEGLGKLAVLCGVKDFPMRVKCATLAWHTLLSAIEGGGKVSTE
jgi:nitrogen fixation NifU-like protein